MDLTVQLLVAAQHEVLTHDVLLALERFLQEMCIVAEGQQVSGTSKLLQQALDR